MKIHESVTDKRSIKRFKSLELEFNKIYNNYYDYSMSLYVNSKTKFKYRCPKHRILKTTSHNHLKGKSCKLCYYGKEDKLGFKETFIERSHKVHKNKYDYSKVKYKNIHSEVIIICPKHGEFNQSPNNHQRGNGCIDCGGRKQSNSEMFIKQSKLIHGETYDYSNVIYTKSREKVTIICLIHGVYKQTPNGHLLGKDCQKCGDITRGVNQTFSKEDFINKSQKIHGNKYSYEKVNFKTMAIDVIIICKEHGEFKQQPFIHSVGSGCPLCSDYGFHIHKKSILYIRKIILDNKVGLKYGITNQMDGNRENQQKRGMKRFDSFETIYKSKIFDTGEKVLEIENIIKTKFGVNGFFNNDEMKDGWTETIPFNKENLNYIKLLIKNI
jgi:hypothetical protein